MQSLGAQMSALLNKRYSNVNEKACMPFLKEVFERMKQLTQGGQTFTNLQYMTGYQPKRAKYRDSKGFQTSYVDLRAERKRIEESRQNMQKTYSEIGFQEGGNIFYQHQNSTRYPRQIFPKVWANVPDDIRETLHKRIVNIMNGRNA
jgi:hypothetical protein